jgi:hypothetical protein
LLSLIEAIQRWLGRNIRAVIRKDVDGTLHVPPERLDTPKLTTHKAFGNIPTVRKAIDFLINMADKLRDIPSIAEEEEEAPTKPPRPVDTGATLSSADKLNLAAAVVKEREGRLIGSVEDLIDHISDGSEEKEVRARQWVDTVQRSPKEASEDFVSQNKLRMVPAIMRESPTVEPSADILHRFLRRNFPDHPEILSSLDHPSIRLMALRWYEDQARRFYLEEYKPLETLEDLRKRLVFSIVDAFKPHVRTESRDFQLCVFRLVGGAVKIVLGAKGEWAGAGCDWDKPQYHVILHRTDILQHVPGIGPSDRGKIAMQPRNHFLWDGAGAASNGIKSFASL